MKGGRAFALLALVLVIGLGVVALRRATQSTHYSQDPSSTTRVVVDARTNREEPSHTIDELVEAQLNLCVVQVGSDPVGDVKTVSAADGRYAIVLRPALDSTDRKQYEGCLEDWTLDHQLLHVVSMDTDPGRGDSASPMGPS